MVVTFKWKKKSFCSIKQGEEKMTLVQVLSASLKMTGLCGNQIQYINVISCQLGDTF
jgi:hypothetical protein